MCTKKQVANFCNIDHHLFVTDHRDLRLSTDDNNNNYNNNNNNNYKNVSINLIPANVAQGTNYKQQTKNWRKS